MKTQYTIGKYLRDTGKSLSELARDAGLNHSVLSRIMSGSTKNLTVDTAERIAHATDYTMSVYEVLGLQPMYIIREVPVHQSKEKVDDSPPNIEAAPAKDCTSPTPSFGTTVGSTSLSRIPSTAQMRESYLLEDIFKFWVSVFAKDPNRTKLTLKRKRAIQHALKSHDKPEVILQSIQGFANDPWRQAEPVRNELATLLREDNIERGLNLLEKYATKGEEPQEDDFWEQQAKQEREAG